MEKQINMYRHEIKYFINKRHASELSLFLSRCLNIDSNTKKGGSYWVRSLYFDTLSNKEYYEKILGYNTRKKIRLRIYDTSTTTVKLEVKNKYNNYILKETVGISREDANKLIQGDSNCLLPYNQNTTNKVYAFMHRNLYRPTVIIDYQREAYFYPFKNIRITIDKDLSAAYGTSDLFSGNLCMVPVYNKDIFILEIKYDHMIPVFIKKVLSYYAIQKSQISKYCLGREALEK